MLNQRKILSEKISLDKHRRYWLICLFLLFAGVFCGCTKATYLNSQKKSDDAGENNSTKDAEGQMAGDLSSMISDSEVLAPIFTSLLGAGAASDGYINSTEISSSEAIATLIASDYTMATYTAILSNASNVTCDGTLTYNNSSVPTIATMPSTDGDYVVCVKLTNNGDKIIYGKSQIIVRDTIAPTVDVGPDVSANAIYSINTTTSGASSFVWSRTSGPGTITFGTPLAEDTTVVANSEGTYVLRLTATDAAGNSAYDELNFVWDVTPPTFTSLNSANQASDGYVNIADHSSTASTYTLVAANYTTVTYSGFLASTVTCNNTQTYSATSIPAINTTPTTDGSYVICVKLVDTANNITYGKSQTIVVDLTAPTVNVGADLSKNASYLINATTSGASSFVWSRTSGPGTITFGTPLAEDTTVVANSEGTYVLRLTATDSAGNSAYDELNFVWDLTPPTVNVGADISAEELFTRTPTVSGGASYAWTVSSGVSSNIIFASSATAATSIVGMNAGIYVLRLTVTDAAGNSAYDEFTLTWGKLDHLVFVTSTDQPPSGLTGLASADTACQARATAAGLPGNYVALLSSETVDANTRVTFSGYIRNRVGHLLATSHADFWDGSLLAANSYDENGGSGGWGLYWTGSNANGTKVSGLTCSSWTSTAGNGVVGSKGSLRAWAYSQDWNCTGPFPLLCASSTPSYPFNQLEARTGAGSGVVKVTYRLPATVTNINRVEVRVAAGTTPPTNCSSGNLAFTWNTGISANATLTNNYNTGASASAYAFRACVYNSSSVLLASHPALASAISGSATVHTLFITSTGYSGNMGGIAGADANCQARATAAGLAGTYKAIISTDTSPANSRITISGNVKLVNGSIFAGNSVEFWDGWSYYQPDVTELNTTSTNVAWTNSKSDGSSNSTGWDCTDWTATTETGLVGDPNTIGGGWLDANWGTTCANAYALYCISQ